MNRFFLSDGLNTVSGIHSYSRLHTCLSAWIWQQEGIALFAFISILYDWEASRKKRVGKHRSNGQQGLFSWFDFCLHFLQEVMPKIRKMKRPKTVPAVDSTWPFQVFHLKSQHLITALLYSVFSGFHGFQNKSKQSKVDMLPALPVLKISHWLKTDV